MRLIGYWKTSPHDADYFPPMEFVRAQSEEDCKLIGDYLSNGEVYKHYRGYSYCRFCQKENGAREFSDGYWVWPEGLAHYILNHGVWLPEEFNWHVKNAIPRIPKANWSDQLDLTFWKSWCVKNISADYWTQFAIDRDEADRHLEEQNSKLAAELMTKHGASTQICQWIGCTNPALNNRAFCGRCSLR